jgi:hypothetical protein
MPAPAEDEPRGLKHEGREGHERGGRSARPARLAGEPAVDLPQEMPMSTTPRTLVVAGCTWQDAFEQAGSL